MSTQIHVVAGALFDADGRVLITQRPAGKHMAGRWEFPGGKLHEGEDRRTGLDRELREELGVQACEAQPLIRCRHRYADRDVLLDVWRVEHYEGEPLGLEGQALQWLRPEQLDRADILEADRPIIAAIQLPQRYVVLSTGPDLARSCARVAELDGPVPALWQIRPSAPSRRFDRTELADAMRLCGPGRVLLWGDPAETVEHASSVGAAGIHIPAACLDTCHTADLPPRMLVGVSCRDAADLAAATRIGARFATLGPVIAPDGGGLGWARFGVLADMANLPVYAGGGLTEVHARRAITAGAQGVTLDELACSG